MKLAINTTISNNTFFKVRTTTVHGEADGYMPVIFSRKEYYLFGLILFYRKTFKNALYQELTQPLYKHVAHQKRCLRFLYGSLEKGEDLDLCVPSNLDLLHLYKKLLSAPS